MFPSSRTMMKRVSQRRQTNALSLIRELASESNAHGVAKIARATTAFRQCMWFLFVTIGIIAAIVQFSFLVKKYVEFQVVEVSKIRYGMPVLYPSVTVCSLAAVSLTKSKKIMTPTSDAWQWIEFTTLHPYQRLSSLQGFYENLKEDAHQLAYNIDDFILHCTFNKKNCSALNFTLHFDGSHYYSCFTFNQGSASKEEELMMQATGPQYGLSLILALDNDDAPLGYYGVYNINSNIENGAGVRVTVHEPNTIPFPVDHGFDIPPGYSTSVSLKASLHSRLSKPYGNCTTKMLSGRQIYKHTIFSCLQVCQQDIVVKTCGCKASGLPNPKNMKKQHLKYCGEIIGWRKMLNKSKNNLSTNFINNFEFNNINDTTPMYNDSFTEKNDSNHVDEDSSVNNFLKDLMCEERVLYKLANNRSYEKGCKCYQPCSELRYEKSISLSYWPLEFYQFHILKTLMKDRINDSFLYDAYQYLFNLSENRTAIEKDENARDKQLQASKLIRQNLVRLNVYIEDLSVVEFKQMPAYELADLFADIGGTLGLWMGISVLTIVELIEVLVRLSLLIVRTERKVEKPIRNGSIDKERRYSYERTFDTDLETPV